MRESDNRLKALTAKKLPPTTPLMESGKGKLRLRGRDFMKSKLKGTLDIVTFDQSSKADRHSRVGSVFKLDDDQDGMFDKVSAQGEIRGSFKSTASKGFGCGLA
jgi:hypothetical protein